MLEPIWPSFAQDQTVFSQVTRSRSAALSSDIFSHVLASSVVHASFGSQEQRLRVGQLQVWVDGGRVCGRRVAGGAALAAAVAPEELDAPQDAAAAALGAVSPVHASLERQETTHWLLRE